MTHRKRPDAENTLTVITWTGLLIAVVLACGALGLYDFEARWQHWDFWVVAALTLVFVIGHAPLKWWAPAVRLALVGWVGLMILCVGVLWRLAFALPVILVIPTGIA